MNIELEKQFCRQKEFIIKLEQFIAICKCSYVTEDEMYKYSDDNRMISEMDSVNKECSEKIHLANELINFCKKGDILSNKIDVAEWIYNNGNFRYQSDYDYVLQDTKTRRRKHRRSKILSRSKKILAISLYSIGFLFWLFMLYLSIVLPFMFIFSSIYIIVSTMFFFEYMFDINKYKKEFRKFNNSVSRSILNDAYFLKIYLSEGENYNNKGDFNFVYEKLNDKGDSL